MPYFPLSWALSHLLPNFTSSSLFTELKSFPHVPSSLLLGPCALPPLLRWRRLCPCSLLRAPPPLTDASALLSPTQGFTPAALPSASSALLMFSSHHFFSVCRYDVISPIFNNESSLDSIFPFHVTPSPFTQNYSKEHSVCNFSPFILSSTHLDEDFLFIYSTAPVRVANEPCMLHPIDISHPLSSS